MRWVKLTLAPVVRANWLFKIWRFTSSRRAGTVRTLVAVGIPRLACMLAARRDAAPRRATGASGSSRGPAAAASGPAAGSVGGAGIASRDRGGSVAETPSGGAATGDDDAPIAAGAVRWPAPLLAGARTSLGPAGGGVSTTTRDAGSGPGRSPVKNSRQLSPTEAGSTRNRSYMSSTSHAFGPNEPAATSDCVMHPPYRGRSTSWGRAILSRLLMG